MRTVFYLVAPALAPQESSAPWELQPIWGVVEQVVAEDRRGLSVTARTLISGYSLATARECAHLLQRVWDQARDRWGEGARAEAGFFPLPQGARGVPCARAAGRPARGGGRAANGAGNPGA